jgi:N-dimethylarginine dimethylaminohydrolase
VEVEQMRKVFGCQSMFEPLKRVLVRRPDEAFAVDDPAAWHYSSRPDLAVARAEHDALTALLRRAGAEVCEHSEPLPGMADSIFVRDPVLICDQGAIILSLEKKLRRGEEAAVEKALVGLGVPVHARLSGSARAEGGDLCWLDPSTLVAGVGFRTNRAGVEQLRAALEPLSIEVIGADLPYFKGPETCLHLMSVLSPVGRDLAVVYPPLLPVAVWKALSERGYTVVEVPDEELETMGPNVLALAPGLCLMLEGNPTTRRRLERAGCEVWTYRGNELSLKAEGGVTCLTQPILREPE